MGNKVHIIQNGRLVFSNPDNKTGFKIQAYPDGSGNYLYKFPDNLYCVVREGILSPVDEKNILGFCCVCSKKIDNKSAHHFHAPLRSVRMIDEDNLICKNCLKDFAICEFCDHYHYKDELDKETKLCPHCYVIVPKHYINNYTYKIDEERSALGKSKDGILYGVELEYETADRVIDILKTIDLLKKWGILKRDSSLEKGFEIVTVPCSLEQHYEIWEEFFKKLPSTVKVYRNCGMHVHATRNRLTNLQLGKMLVFLHNPENRKFIEIIAERKSNMQNNYEIIKTLKDGAHGGMVPQNADRHTALNLNNYNTIEFRIFNSPKNHLTLLKNVEFCKALIKFTGMAEHSIPQAKSYQIFCNYVKTYRKEYPYLSNFLKKYDSAISR